MNVSVQFHVHAHMPVHLSVQMSVHWCPDMRVDLCMDTFKGVCPPAGAEDILACQLDSLCLDFGDIARSGYHRQKLLPLALQACV